MTPAKPQSREPEPSQLHPWYRYAWPWVAIAIPAVAVAGGLFTLYLAVTNPDPVIVEEPQYQELRAGLQAQPQARSDSPAADAERDDGDGDD